MSIVKVTDIEVRWNMAKRTMMELALKVAYFGVGTAATDEVLSDSGAFLQHGNIGRDFYDILVVGAVNREDYLVVIENKILAFCNTYKPYDFVEFVRTFYTSRTEKNSPHFNTLLTTLSSIVFSGYNCGYLIGSNPEDRAVYAETDLLGPKEVNVLMLIVATMKMGPVKLAHTVDGRISEFKFSRKQLDRIKKYMSLPVVAALVKDLSNAPREHLAQTIQSSSKSIDVIYFGNFMNIVSDEGYPYYADFYRLANWEREETVSTGSLAIKIYQVVTDRYYQIDDILKHRNLYVPSRGVVLKFNEKADDIDSLMLREYHDDKFHFLYISYTVEGTLRFLPFDMSNISNSFIHVLYETDVTALLMAFSFLGLTDYLRKSPSELMDMFKFYGNKDLSDEEVVNYSANIDSLLDGISKYVSEENIRFEAPVHWNYEQKSKPVQTPWGDTYLIKDREIGIYTRKLPAGQKASEDAKALAAKVFMELGEDRTIVDKFVRKVKVKLNTSNHF